MIGSCHEPSPVRLRITVHSCLWVRTNTRILQHNFFALCMRSPQCIRLSNASDILEHSAVLQIKPHCLWPISLHLTDRQAKSHFVTSWSTVQVLHKRRPGFLTRALTYTLHHPGLPLSPALHVEAVTAFPIWNILHNYDEGLSQKQLSVHVFEHNSLSLPINSTKWIATFSSLLWTIIVSFVVTPGAHFQCSIIWRSSLPLPSVRFHGMR